MSEFKCFSNMLFSEDVNIRSEVSIRSIETKIAELKELHKSGGSPYDIQDYMSDITNSLSELEVCEWTRTKLQNRFRSAIDK